jgi:hypothetical protein
VHELDVLRERLAERLRHRLRAPVGDEAAPDLGLDLSLELLDAILVLLALESLLQGGHVGRHLLLGRVHHLLEHVVEVEVAQRPIQVIGTADRSTRFHPREALNRLLRERPHRALITVHQRLHEHLGDLFGCERLHAALASALALHLLLHLAPELVEIGFFIAVGDLVLGSAEAEVDLEDRLEAAPVGVVLDQRRPECVLERLAVLDRDVLNRLHRVEVLGERHREAGVAQFDDEATEQIEHGARRAGGAGAHWRCGVGHGSVLGERRLSRRPRAPWRPSRCRSDT